jgi:hypothetical protein
VWPEKFAGTVTNGLLLPPGVSRSITVPSVAAMSNDSELAPAGKSEWQRETVVARDGDWFAGADSAEHDMASISCTAGQPPARARRIISVMSRWFTLVEQYQARGRSEPSAARLAAYFRVGNSARKFMDVDHYLRERLAKFLAKKAGHGGHQRKRYMWAFSPSWRLSAVWNHYGGTR